MLELQAKDELAVSIPSDRHLETGMGLVGVYVSRGEIRAPVWPLDSLQTL